MITRQRQEEAMPASCPRLRAAHSVLQQVPPQTRPAAPIGRQQAGQLRGMRQQFGSAAIAQDRDDGPDPAARQGKPTPTAHLRRGCLTLEPSLSLVALARLAANPV